MEMLRVRDVMTDDVTCVHADSDVHDLEKLLLERRVHGVPVIDDDEKLVGVVSQTDLLAWHHNTGIDGIGFYESIDPKPSSEYRGLRLGDIPAATVRDVMSPVVHGVRADRPLAVAASTMVIKRIHRLVVVDDDMHVEGIISAVDILRAVPGVERLLPEEELRSATRSAE